jgi:allophanate hydrolase subunit 2
LVGNNEADAAVEITLVGPAFTLTADTLLAVCGGDFERE